MYSVNGKGLGQGLLETIPGVDTAINTIKAKVGEFLGLGIRIQNALKRAFKLNEFARQAGKNVEAGKASASIAALQKAQITFVTTESKLKQLMDGLKAAKVPGFGVLPIALGLLALTVVAGVTGLIKYVSFQEKVLDDIEKGLIPAGYKPSALFGISIGGMTPLLIGGAALLGLMFFMRR